MDPVTMIVKSSTVFTRMDAFVHQSPSPVARNRMTSTSDQAKTRNWIGARIPCTKVHFVALRRARCSGV